MTCLKSHSKDSNQVHLTPKANVSFRLYHLNYHRVTRELDKYLWTVAPWHSKCLKVKIL